MPILIYDAMNVLWYRLSTENCDLKADINFVIPSKFQAKKVDLCVRYLPFTLSNFGTYSVKYTLYNILCIIYSVKVTTEFLFI